MDSLEQREGSFGCSKFHEGRINPRAHEGMEPDGDKSIREKKE